MVFITFTCLLMYGAMYLMAKKNLTMQGPFNITRRVLMLLIVFNAMNMTLSTCLIQDLSIFQITIAGVILLLTVWQIYDLMKNLKKYFYFDKMFDLNNKKIKYFILSLIIMRILQSVSIALLRKQTLIAAIFNLSLQAVFTIAITLLRPYTIKTYNLLTIISEWSVLAFLSVNLFINLNFIKSQ